MSVETLVLIAVLLGYRQVDVIEYQKNNETHFMISGMIENENEPAQNSSVSGS